MPFLYNMHISSISSFLPSLPTVPGGPPLNIALDYETPERISFTWNPPVAPNGVVTYTIECISEDVTVPNLPTAKTIEETIVITTFTPAAIYNCSFTPSTIAGNGPAENVTIVSCMLLFACMAGKYTLSRLVNNCMTEVLLPLFST